MGLLLLYIWGLEHKLILLVLQNHEADVVSVWFNIGL